MLGDILGVGPGRDARVEVLEGGRSDLPVALVDDGLGLQAYMRIDAVQRMLHEGSTLSGAALTLDQAVVNFYATVKLPGVAGVACATSPSRTFVRRWRRA
jgi:putative ABC transport system permease protein